MVYTVQKAITNAFYKSSIRSRQFDTVLAPDQAVGLDSLNKMLAQKTIDTADIPYFQRLDFTLINGVAEYFIPNLIDISTLTFFIDSVRYSTGKQSRDQFFGSARAVNINSLPFSWHMEREFNTASLPPQHGARLFLYFVPNSNYPMEIWGTFSLNQVILNQDLSASMDLFYIDFLEFQLAQRLCAEYDFEVPPGISEELKRMYVMIGNQSAQLDNKGRRITCLNTKSNTLNYADVNVGHGWRP